MSKATLTMIGLYNWDPDLFKNLVLPDGIDRNTTIDCILLQSGEFEVLYSDCDFMENAIGYVSRKWQRTFQKWYEALQLEYHPIENYDRYEEWTDEGTNTGTVTHGTSHKTDSTGSEETDSNSSENVAESNSDHTEGSSSDQSASSSQTDTLVSTYDSNALNPDNESKSSQSANSSGSTQQDTTGSNKSDKVSKSSGTATKSEKITETGSDDESRNLGTSGRHEGHLHGNIGVTTSQEMLQAELDIDSWNLYEHIADIFVRELCIPVY